MEITYLGTFKKAASYFELSGNKILIERLELGEVKSAGGIIMVENTKMHSDLKLHKPLIAIVLAVGKGYFDATDNSYTPLEVEPGNIVILNANGASFFSVVPGLANYSANKIGLTTESDIQITFKTLRDYEDYVEALK